MTVPSIVVDCYLGAWSDVLGRKFTLLMPPIGAIAGTAVYIAKGGKHFGYRVVRCGWESQCSATMGLTPRSGLLGISTRININS